MNLKEYLIRSPKKHLIFDFDETLFHLLLPWEIFRKKLKQILKKLDPSLNFKVKKITPLINEALLKHREKAKGIISSWQEEFEKEYLKGTPVNSDLISFLKKNKEKYRYYIWSSNMSKTITSILKRHNLESFFQKIISAESVSLRKPYVDGFYQIFDSKIHKKRDFLLIGDSDFDKQAAKKAGIDYFKVNLYCG